MGRSQDVAFVLLASTGCLKQSHDFSIIGAQKVKRESGHCLG
jgi:hypothetical protein